MDTGPHSADALVWLEERFHAVALGNHERAIRGWFEEKVRGSRERAQDWLREVPRRDYARWYEALSKMPLAFMIESPHGTVGLIHAQTPDSDWGRAIEMLSTGCPYVADIALPGFETMQEKRGLGLDPWRASALWCTVIGP